MFTGVLCFADFMAASTTLRAWIPSSPVIRGSSSFRTADRNEFSSSFRVPGGVLQPSGHFFRIPQQSGLCSQWIVFHQPLLIQAVVFVGCKPVSFQHSNHTVLKSHHYLCMIFIFTFSSLLPIFAYTLDAGLSRR